MNTYRTSHIAPGHGRHYDQTLFSPGAYDAAVWRLEQTVLLTLLEKYFGKANRSILDFACGTGRITQFLIQHGFHPVGLDISEEMLCEARRKVPDVAFVCGDVTMQSNLLDAWAPFDGATAFRFFLNAEPELRSDVLRALHNLLKPGGILICNNHGNVTSLWFWVRLIRRLLGKAVLPQTLPCSTFLRLLRSHGFQVLDVRGVCFLPRGLSRILPESWWTVMERFLQRLRVFDRWAIYQIYVAKRLP